MMDCQVFIIRMNNTATTGTTIGNTTTTGTTTTTTTTILRRNYSKTNKNNTCQCQTITHYRRYALELWWVTSLLPNCGITKIQTTKGQGSCHYHVFKYFISTVIVSFETNWNAFISSCVIFVFSYCVVRVNRSLTLATLLDMQLRHPWNTDGQPILAYFGYFHESTFTVLSGWQYNINSGATSCKISISDVIDSRGGDALSFETCTTTDYVDNGWRVLYLGDQTSIAVVRRQPKLTNRVMDRSCVLSLIHKMIVYRLVRVAFHKLYNNT